MPFKNNRIQNYAHEKNRYGGAIQFEDELPLGGRKLSPIPNAKNLREFFNLPNFRLFNGFIVPIQNRADQVKGRGGNRDCTFVRVNKSDKEGNC